MGIHRIQFSCIQEESWYCQIIGNVILVAITENYSGVLSCQRNTFEDQYPQISFTTSTNTWSLTHWGQVTHICVSKLTIIGSDNGSSPERCQANIWTNAGILLIGTLGTNFSEILSEIHTSYFKKMHLKTSSAKRRPFCLGLNVLNEVQWSHKDGRAPG